MKAIDGVYDKLNAESKTWLVTAFGQKTILNELFAAIWEMVGRHTPGAAAIQPVYGLCRPGDVRHFLADIPLAGKLLSYHPEVDVSQGLRDTVDYGNMRDCDFMQDAGNLGQQSLLVDGCGVKG